VTCRSSALRTAGSSSINAIIFLRAGMASVTSWAHLLPFVARRVLLLAANSLFVPAKRSAVPGGRCAGRDIHRKSAERRGTGDTPRLRVRARPRHIHASTIAASGLVCRGPGKSPHPHPQQRPDRILEMGNDVLALRRSRLAIDQFTPAQLMLSHEFRGCLRGGRALSRFVGAEQSENAVKPVAVLLENVDSPSSASQTSPSARARFRSSRGCPRRRTARNGAR